MLIKKIFAANLLFLILLSPISAQDNSEENNSGILTQLINQLNDITISGQWFLAYQTRDIANKKSNDFLLKRGYLTIEKKFSKNFSGRITQDISVDKEGDGLGDIELRLKYGYLRFKSDDFFIFTNPYVEFGLVHRPWIDFEQKINRYRVQGSMFLDRNDILSSADYGITITTLFGGEISDNFKKNVSKDYPGKYGSLTVGIYNGGGYHAIETNQNKVFEGRLSLRPLPDIIPGFQLNYAKVFGKGNIEASPDFKLDIGGVSYENKFLTLLGYYIKGTGDQSGDLFDTYSYNVETEGFSTFCELKLQCITTSLFGRYEQFESVGKQARTILGIAYHFLGKNKVLIDYDFNTYNDHSIPDDHIVEFAVELRF